MSMLSACRALAPSGVPFAPADIAAGVRAARHEDAALAELRREIASVFGVRHVFLFSSGRAAMSAAFRALGELYPGRDEVAVPAYTSYSVASAIVNAGFRLNPYDLERGTMSPDPQDMARSLNDRTLCLMACHLFGYPVDMDAVRGAASQRGVPVFDDAAQAMGASYRGQPAGALGDVGLFSMSRGKNISAVDGGILVTDRDDLAEVLGRIRPEPVSARNRVVIILKALALCGLLHPRMYWIPRSLPMLKLGASVFDPGFPVKGLTGFQAGLGLRMLDRLDELNRCRKRTADELMRRLPGCEVPRPVSGAAPVFLRLPLLNGRACTVAPELGVVPAYPTTLDGIPGIAPHLARQADYPGAKRLASELVTLPTHGFVSMRDVQTITHTFQTAGGCHG
ncbi:DegT/DnrJ/EryC1/StrS family aminotransferase [Salidesulfovibrio brasiliensis]|uniref:DegT/DnrJ/EryC1/StrS family aminotransferase n=1 Tax=Salidesulfovibrio brasiliensis TaxID=221711 RepID=UPI0006CF319F|nr:DegT/DnrJ/EryC1/StrS family aminotransferase [Salidesulfovibrio brasiliensis]